MLTNKKIPLTYLYSLEDEANQIAFVSSFCSSPQHFQKIHRRRLTSNNKEKLNKRNELSLMS